MMLEMQLQLLGKVVFALLLGGAIGLERESADKPAGLRTHMLVAASATMLTGLGNFVVSELGVRSDIIRTDPIRIIEAVITGITFLGAGTIIRYRGEGEIEGLTTAASLLLVGALGIGIALNQFVLCVGVTIVMLVTLLVIKKFE